MSIFSVRKRDSPERHPIFKGKSLLRPHRKTIAEMQSIVGLEKRFWNHLYFQAMNNLAEYVQALPASEAHHHSGAGGLLQHTLETALNALRIRRGKLLPPNADAETVTRLKDLWTYAVFTGAIAHDLGKPVTDIAVKLYDKNGIKLDNWSAFKGSMLMTGARSYSIQFRHNRNYVAHMRSSALYVHCIIPITGLEWLASNSDVFFYWTNLVTGHNEESGIIGSIIHEADKASVACNLAGDQTITLPAATTSRKPLYQRIVTSLRYQIDQGHLPLNRDGAAGWIKEDKLWLVVKRALDQIRDHMAQEGQTGIPSRNDRIMDELQQYGVLIPNLDRAVWKCQVFDNHWPKAHVLTLLCLPVEKVWIAADAVPNSFSGSVTPIDPSATESIRDESNDIIQETSVKNSDIASLHLTCNAVSQAPEPIFSEEKPESPLDKVGTQSSQSGSNSDVHEANASISENVGEDFLNWLRDGLHERTFNVNDVNSKIHMTREGLLLVSPAIFKQFDKNKWSYVQKRFTKLKLHERNTNGTNIHEYLATGKKKKSLIKGFLITDTANVFPGIELPNTNYVLSKVITE